MPAFFMPICTFVPFSYLLYNKNESEVFSLKKQKYYINLTDQERSEILLIKTHLPTVLCLTNICNNVLSAEWPRFILPGCRK